MITFSSRKIDTKTTAGYIILSFVCLLLIFHSRYSFCQSDESFYIALIDRVWKGGRLFVDEWHPTQFYAPIMLPLYSLYRIIFLDGKGVILFFRIIYILISFICSLFLYRNCHKSYPAVLSLIVALIPLLYSRANIQGLSYYNLCLQFSLLGFLFLFSKNSKIQWFASGVLFFLAELCNPYLFLLIFPLLVVTSIFLSSVRNRAICCIIAQFSSASIYLLWLAVKYNLIDVLGQFHHLLEDSEHQQSIFSRFILILYQYKHNNPLLAVLVLILGVLIVLRSDKMKSGKWLNVIYFALILIVIIRSILLSFNSICYIESLTVTLITFPFIIKKTKIGDIKLGLYLYACGIILALSFFFASNTGLDAMTTGFSLSSAGSLLIIYDHFISKEDFKNRDVFITGKNLILMFSFLLIGTFSVHRFLGIYRDAPIWNLTERIKIGPAAGLYTTAEHQDQYESIVKSLYTIQQKYPNESVLYSKELPLAYAVTDWECSSYTVYKAPINDKRLEQYYTSHARPTIVCIFTEKAGEYERAPFNNHNSSESPNTNDIDCSFYADYICKGSIIEENDYLTVFYIPEMNELTS